MMKRNSGQMHSSYDSAAAAEYTTNAVVTPAPPPASHHHHAHMGLEVNMLNSILSAAPAATTGEGRNSDVHIYMPFFFQKYIGHSCPCFL
jgi:hypothetical protein